MEGRFGIECPRINFPSLDSADFEKFRESLPPHELPSLLKPRASPSVRPRIGRSSRSMACAAGSSSAQNPYRRTCGPLPAWMHRCSKGVSA